MTQLTLPPDIVSTVRIALAEDVGSGDVTAHLIDVHAQARAQVITRESAVICGVAWFTEVFHQIDAQVAIEWLVQDGEHVEPDQVLCRLTGTTRALLTGERTALNFLQLLSGTATQTALYVASIRHTKAQILDTRKTIPCLRTAQKYAVRCGGGTNHRMGLYDAFLIKENHILAAGSIPQALENARQLGKHLPIEIEVESLQELRIALDAGATRILLDNFSLPMFREAVQITQGLASLEASGGISLETLKTIAETGVDFISIGGLTKHVQAVDLSMRMVN
ncbi:carboxylating nicotinate-nucleotide diphosphorylase [Beggiatoa leptomitoformis]|uniref:Probable nicotinate-nucleotide pyrophosphorylase [carboxylating] n=1 Tax=Beggiatoa leptomitoformis TaxID=288004 RepID=A0A2N9YIM6_9GAMM|nr:carboxylating nicotinate-nucleotide diphosphorylase [Beggiatoa leptomitoformis]ALG67407.1 carboxylating nicotinate-nucleotide diphosphorylase [Beggiatoa leptomitoformis]AUI70382.1 carboxylating nicotinate-nucleotide diphosphorylase [Beggiatoa leptomitoformis]